MKNNSFCNRSVAVRSRREFLEKSSYSFGALALGYLMNGTSAFASTGASDSINPLAPNAPLYPAKAKSVIFLFTEGGPSHVDTFDPKPTLTRLEGQPLPPSIRKGD